MLNSIKSIGSKAVSTITFSSKIDIWSPSDPQLDSKLQQISHMLLKADPAEQFKVYQQLQSKSSVNAKLRDIYLHEQTTTETLNSIIKFYTFLLTNSKNELVICKLVSEPLVIELTKIVLSLSQTGSSVEEPQAKKSPSEIAEKEVINEKEQLHKQRLADNTNSLHYLENIDWEEVNAYKVALIRSYINCINPQTVKYMIVDGEMPIFSNCIQGFYHYLSEGVEGTCISNCILMILTKVNHNEEICQIIFDPLHRTNSNSQTDSSQFPQGEKPDKQTQLAPKLAKSISKRKLIRLHEFISDIVEFISQQIEKVFQYLQAKREELSAKLQPTNSQNTLGFEVELLLSEHHKASAYIEFVEANSLFCVDLINSINNYNYTSKMKETLGLVIEEKLTQKITKFTLSQPEETRYSWLLISILKMVFQLTIVTQSEASIVSGFLNKNCVHIWSNALKLSKAVYSSNFETEMSNQRFFKQQLTVVCDCSWILLKQVISPHSKLASRKKLQYDESIQVLKDSILESVLGITEKVSSSETLREKICFKAIRNMLLSIFYLTIRETACEVESEKGVNIGLALQFKYNLLVLHCTFTMQLKQCLSDNRNWQYIVNNYEPLMEQLPRSILSAEENARYCHFHNGNASQTEDQIRNRILICEAIRNYRYMIIKQSNLIPGLTRLQNIYHKHFLSPGWHYTPGETISFNAADEYNLICPGFLYNNSNNKLPIEILQDPECFLVCYRLATHKYRVIANIRFKQINGFVPEKKNTVKLKLHGIQELVLDFVSSKTVLLFKEYLSERRNKAREKQLKFINHYLLMYHKDSQQLIQAMYQGDLVGLDWKTHSEKEENGIQGENQQQGQVPETNEGDETCTTESRVDFSPDKSQLNIQQQGSNPNGKIQEPENTSEDQKEDKEQEEGAI